MYNKEKTVPIKEYRKSYCISGIKFANFEAKRYVKKFWQIISGALSA